MKKYLRLSMSYKPHIVDEAKPTPRCGRIENSISHAPPCSFLDLQSIAHARLCQDMPRLLWIRFQLLPQLADEDPQRLHVRTVLTAPHLAQQVAMCQHLAGVNHELLENVVLLGRQPHLVAADADAPMHEIDAEIGGLKQRPAALLLQAMAQCCADAGHQLVDAERLGH